MKITFKTLTMNAEQKKKAQKYTNYVQYSTRPEFADKVNDEDLLRVIEKCRDRYKEPYVRFFWVSNKEEAICQLYVNNTKMTRLVTISELENLLS